MKFLGESWTDKVTFWKKKDVKTKKAYDEYEDAKTIKKALEETLNEKIERLDQTVAKISGKTKQINDFESSIAIQKQKIKEVGTGLLGVLPWLSGLLFGLT